MYPVLKEGFLIKKGGQRRNWTKRWFRLTSQQLEYYKAIMDSEPRGVINLIDITSVTISDKKPSCFSVTTNKRVYYIRAAKDHIREEWIREIEHAVAECKK